MTSLRAARRFSVRAYTAVAFSILSILLTVILTAVIGRTVATRVESSIGVGLAELALQTTDKLERGMFERYREVQLLAQRFDRETAATADERRRTLEGVQRTYSHYAWIGMTDPAGKVKVATGGLLEGADVSKRPWFRNALKNIYLGDVHEAVLLAKLLPGPANEPKRFVDVAFPYHDAQGAVAGILGIHLSWQWAREVEQSVIEPVARRRKVEAFVVAADGVVLLGPPGMPANVAALPSFRAASAGRSDFSLETWADGKEYLVGYSKDNGYRAYPGLGWTVLVRQSADEAFAPVQAIQSRVFWTGMGVALLFTLLGLYAARAISRPIWGLAQSVQRVEDGAAEQIESPGRSYFEVQALTRAFNSLLRKLRRKEEDLRELNATLEKRVHERTGELELALQTGRRNAQRIATIIETAQDAFIGTDLNGLITDWNTQAEKMLGWQRSEALGRPLVELAVPERYRDSFRRALSTVAAHATPAFLNGRIERIVLTRGGEELHVEMTIGLIEADSTHFFGAFLHDISERKKVESMKAEFVSTVSHELRTPLTAICGALGLLSHGAAGEIPPTAKGLLDIATKSSERLGRLVNDILDIEKITSGTMEFDLRAQWLAPLIEQAVESTQSYAAQLGVTLAFDRGQADAQVAVDADRITQVLVNLLSNAAKFSPQSATVVVRTALEPDGLRVSVIDRGEGIPESFHARIFDRFAQVDASDSRRKGGTGLGLAICKSIVEQHGGRIGFLSTPGNGSEFYFMLPLAG